MKKYYTLIILIFFVLNVILSFKIYKTNRELKLTTHQLNEYKSDISVLEQISWIQFYDSGSQIDTNILLTGSKGVAMSFVDLITINTIIVYIPEGECGPCIVNQIGEIKESLYLEHDNDVLFISSFLNIQDQTHFETEVELKIYNINDYRLGTLFERQNHICLFKLDSKMNIKFLYLPNRPKSVNKNRYYKSLKSMD